MRFRALYLDLDGTLLNDAGEIPAVLGAAIARVQERGVAVGLATGRRATTTKPYATAVGVNAPCVLFNGAHVVTAGFDAALFATALPHAATLATIERALGLGVYVAASVGERVLVDRRRPLPPGAGTADARGAAELVDLIDLDTAPTKLLFIDEPARLALLRGELLRAGLPEDAHLVRSKPRFLELLPDGVSKGSALRFCAGQLGVALDDMVCCGDEENDLAMLEAAGCAVAFAHSPAGVRAAADVVVADNDGPALAAALQAVFGLDD